MIVAGPGGAGAVLAFLAGPNGASYNEISPICENLRPFAVYQRLFDPFLAIFDYPGPKKPIFRRFWAPTRASGLQNEDFSAVYPPRRPFCPVFRLPRPPRARLPEEALAKSGVAGESGPLRAHAKTSPQKNHAEAWTTYPTPFVVQPSDWARKCPVFRRPWCCAPVLKLPPPFAPPNPYPPYFAHSRITN